MASTELEKKYRAAELMEYLHNAVESDIARTKQFANIASADYKSYAKELSAEAKIDEDLIKKAAKDTLADRAITWNNDIIPEHAVTTTEEEAEGSDLITVDQEHITAIRDKLNDNEARKDLFAAAAEIKLGQHDKNTEKKVRNAHESIEKAVANSPEAREHLSKIMATAHAALPKLRAAPKPEPRPDTEQLGQKHHHYATAIARLVTAHRYCNCIPRKPSIFHHARDDFSLLHTAIMTGHPSELHAHVQKFCAMLPNGTAAAGPKLEIEEMTPVSIRYI